MRHLEKCEETSSTFARDSNTVVIADRSDSFVTVVTVVRGYCFAMHYLQFVGLNPRMLPD